jgi:hypothetical protein
MPAEVDFALVLELLTLGIAWVLIPLIMGGLVVVARSLVSRAEGEERRTAARAGWWSGLLLFLIYFIHSLPDFGPPDPTAAGTITLGLWPILLGAGMGFALLWGLSFLSAARVGGLVVLLLTAAGLGSLHTYLFLEDRGGWLVAGMLGGSLGALLHLIIFPGSLTGKDEDEKGQAVHPSGMGVYRG